MLSPRFSKGWPSANQQSREHFKKILEQIQKIGCSRACWIVGSLSVRCLFSCLLSVVNAITQQHIWGGCYLCVVGVVLLQAVWRLSPSNPTLLANLLPGLAGTPGASAGAAGGCRFPFSCFGWWSLVGPPPSRGFQIGEPRKKWKIMGFRVQRECQRSATISGTGQKKENIYVELRDRARSQRFPTKKNSRMTHVEGG